MKPSNPIQSVGIILLCLFHITYIVEAAEAGHEIQGIQWIYKCEDEVVYDSETLEGLYAIETLAQSTHFGRNPEDFRLLSTLCKGVKECLQKKSKAIIKYNLKVESIQCINAALMMAILPKIYEGEQRMFRLKSMSKNKVNPYKQMVSRMLALLYFLKVSTHKYLWHYYLRILMPEDQGVYEKVNQDYATAETLKKELEQHLKLCRQNEYLPTNYGQTAANQIDEENQIITLGQKLYDVNEHDNLFLNNVYEFADQFNIKYLTLSNTYPNENSLLEKSRIPVNWENTKLLFNINKPNITKGPHGFILRPFQFTGYQQMVMRAVKTNVLYLTWLHCAMLHDILIQSLTNSNISPSIINRLMTFKQQLVAPLSTAVQDLNLEDIVFDNVIVNLTVNIKDSSFVEPFLRQVEVMNKELKNIVKENLLKLGISQCHAQAIFNLPRKINLEKDITAEPYFQHVNILQEYTDTVKTIMAPVNFNFVKYFLAGKSELYETFFFQFPSIAESWKYQHP